MSARIARAIVSRCRSPPERPLAGAQHGVVAVGQSHDPIVDLGLTGSGLDLGRGGIGHGQRDVLSNGAMHELRLLQDESDAGVELVGRQRPNILSINGYRALLHVVEASQERGQCRLA